MQLQLRAAAFIIIEFVPPLSMSRTRMHLRISPLTLLLVACAATGPALREGEQETMTDSVTGLANRKSFDNNSCRSCLSSFSNLFHLPGTYCTLAGAPDFAKLVSQRRELGNPAITPTLWAKRGLTVYVEICSPALRR